MATNENVELEELIRRATSPAPSESAALGAVPPPTLNLGSDEDDDESLSLDVGTLLLVARRSLLWVLLLIGLGITSSWLYLRYTKPVYKSASLLKIDERTEANDLGLSASMATGADIPRANKLAGEVELIKSNLIYNQLKKSLALDVNYYLQGTVLENELYNTSPFHVTYTITDPTLYNRKFNVIFISLTRFKLGFLGQGRTMGGEFDLDQPISLPGISLRITGNQKLLSEPGTLEPSYHFTIQNDVTINSYLDRNLAVEIVNPDANTIQIAFTDFNPSKAQSIVNNIDTVYLHEKVARKQEANDKKLRFLDEQLTENRNSLQAAEQNLQNYVGKNKTYDPKGDLVTIGTKLEKQQADRLVLEQKIKLLNDVAALANQEQLTPSENQTVEQSFPGLAALEDPLLTTQLNELNSLQWDLRRVGRSYTDKTEAVQLKQEALNYARRNLKRLLAQDQRLVRDQLALMDRQRDELSSVLQTLPQKETELARLKRPMELYEKSYLTLMEKKVDFNIAKAGTIPDFQILSPASPPAEPISPVRLLVYAIGLAGGLFLGLGLIGVRYLMHNTVSSARELERSTPASVLGVIPTYDKEKMEVSRLIVDKSSKSAISESIRSIRTNLDFISSGKQKRMISITSTISGEGKTFVTVNLGGIIAMSGQRVIILDLDMRKPKVNLAFGTENVRGVSTILIERHSLAECIQHTSIESLDFISAGPTPPNPSELILSPKFDQLVAELFKSYDVVLIDTPPVGLVTDGILIMRKADNSDLYYSGRVLAEGVY